VSVCLRKAAAMSVAPAIGLSAPAGIPREIVDIRSNAIKNSTRGADLKARFAEMAMAPDYPDPEGYGKFWDEGETAIKPAIDEALATNK
jgi:tripartite-type tricarboxylate transporter receptor subunit TctC